MSKSAKRDRPWLGAHVSIAGAIGESFLRGKAMGCDCIQIFTKSSGQWAAKPLSDADAEVFKRNWRNTGIQTVIAHDSYLLNLGSPDQTARHRSVAGFIDELERCEKLDIPYLVAHPGAHSGSGE